MKALFSKLPLILCGFVTACLPPEVLEKRRQENARKEQEHEARVVAFCRDKGYAEGTQAFDRCREEYSPILFKQSLGVE